MRRRLALLLSVLALAGVAPCFWAEEGRIPIFEPVLLTGAEANGKFILTRNITVTNQSVINVSGTGTEEFDLDLNGFTITQTAATAANVMNVVNVRSLVIRNGNIVVSSNISRAINTALTPVPGSRLVVEDLKITGGDQNILFQNASSVTIRRNFFDSSEGAIFFWPSSVVVSGTIEGNVIRNCERGIDVSTAVSGLTIRSNQIEATLYSGITTDGITQSTVVDNAILHDATGILIRNGDNVMIHGNRIGADAGGTKGISVEATTNSTIRGNVVSNHTQSGIVIDAASAGLTIEQNSSNLNGDHGILILGNDNRYGRNTARGNSGNTACAGATCGTLDFCDAGVGNVSFGDNLIPGPPPC